MLDASSVEKYSESHGHGMFTLQQHTCTCNSALEFAGSGFNRTAIVILHI